MKKTYQTPTATVVELEAQTMLAASVVVNSNSSIEEDDDIGGNEFGRTNRQSFWDSYDE